MTIVVEDGALGSYFKCKKCGCFLEFGGGKATVEGDNYRITRKLHCNRCGQDYTDIQIVPREETSG